MGAAGGWTGGRACWRGWGGRAGGPAGEAEDERLEGVLELAEGLALAQLPVPVGPAHEEARLL
jgi:hypothetical protein